MRPKLPTLGEPPRKSSFGKAVIFALVVGLIAGGYWYFKRANVSIVVTRGGGAAPQVAVAPGTTSPGQPATPEQMGAAPTAGGAPVAVAPVTGTPVTPPPATPAVEKAPGPPGIRRAQISIDGPLESALVASVGREVGPALSQVVTRALVWWVNVPNDLRRNDTLDILFQERIGEEPVVHAVRFVSGKTGRTYRAYRYQAPGDAYPRMYQPGGEELEMRLEDSPMDDYEQITSLIRDGRRHKGVDFKAPVGSKVKAPFDGRIVRKNWNFRANGNCLELVESNGRRKALFLHLNELSQDIRVGMTVKRGDVIADSGNTGRSFAPHLHYQLETAGGRVLDPFDSHKSYRRKLPESAMAGLNAEINKVDAQMPTAVAAQQP